MDTYVIMWLSVFAVSLIIEFMTTSLVCVWFMPSAIVCAVLAFFNISAFVQYIVFFSLFIIFLAIFRKLVSKFVYSRKKDTLTNLDSLIGSVGRVEEEIDNFLGKGRVIVNSQSWSARSEDNSIIPADAKVVVERIEGVKLICHISENN